MDLGITAGQDPRIKLPAAGAGVEYAVARTGFGKRERPRSCSGSETKPG